MPEVSEEKLAHMRSKYRADVAQFLAARATEGTVLTFTDLTKEMGRTPRLWGDILGGIALHCREHDLPILPVLVVSKTTGFPSKESKLFRDFGFLEPKAFEAEQQRCFDYDWSQFHFE